MRELLIAEMKRAIHLLEKNADQPFSYWKHLFGEGAELKSLLKAIRKHSIILEKESKR